MPKQLISIGELIDNSWEHYRRTIIDHLSISCWLLVKALLDIIALALYPTVTTLATNAVLSPTEQAGIILFVLSNAVIAPLIGVWVLAGLVRLTRGQMMGRGDVRAAIKDARAYFVPTLIVSVLLALILLAGLAIGFGPTLILAGLGAWMNNGTLIILANVLLIFGVFVAFVINFRWSVYYVMSPYAVLLDDVGGTAALTRSRTLTQGRFWSVLARYALPKVVFVLFGLVAMGILSYIATLIVSAAAGLNLDVQLRLITITSSVFPVAIAAVVNPLLVISDVMLYKSMTQK